MPVSLANHLFHVRGAALGTAPNGARVAPDKAQPHGTAPRAPKKQDNSACASTAVLKAAASLSPPMTDKTTAPELLPCQLVIGFIYNYCETCHRDEIDMGKCPRKKEGK